MGCHPLSVVTAITAQDTVGVGAVQPVGADWVAEQARLVLADMPVNAFKIGMVATLENAAAIAAVLRAHPAVPVVLDPVLASGRGDLLATGDIAAALPELLMPLAMVVTPNSLEARRLAAFPGERADALPLERCAYASRVSARSSCSSPAPTSRPRRS